MQEYYLPCVRKLIDVCYTQVMNKIEDNTNNTNEEVSQGDVIDTPTAPKSKKKIRFPKFKFKYLLPLIGILAIAFLLFNFKSLFVAAIVNGTPIFRPTVIQYLEKTQGMQVLDNLVTEILISQNAQKRNITVSEDELNSELQKIDETLQSQGLTLETAMQQQNVSREELERQITLQKLLEKMLLADITVTDEEIAQYKENNKYLPENPDNPEATEQIVSEIKQQKLPQQYSIWLQNARENADITYFVNYGIKPAE